MEGIVTVSAVRAGRPNRRGRGCALAAAVLFAASYAGNHCDAVDPTSGSRSAEPPIAGVADAGPMREVPCDAALPSESGSNSREALLLADARLTRFVDRPPQIDRSWDRDGPSVPAERVVAVLPRGAPLYTDNIDAASLRVRLPANDFADEGPGTIKFSVASLDVDSDRSVAGGRAEWIAADDQRGRLLIESRLSWMFEYLQTESAASAFFQPGDKGIFAVQGLSYGSNWALLGVGVRWELVRGWSAFAGYDAQVNSQQQFHIGSAGVAYGW